MTVIVTENVPDRLRGRLTVWFIEVRAGVYIGNPTKKHRDAIWKMLVDQVNEYHGNVVMAWQSNNEVGFEYDMIGDNHRAMVRLDGIALVLRKSAQSPNATIWVGDDQ